MATLAAWLKWVRWPSVLREKSVLKRGPLPLRLPLVSSLITTARLASTIFVREVIATELRLKIETPNVCRSSANQLLLDMFQIWVADSLSLVFSLFRIQRTQLRNVKLGNKGALLALRRQATILDSFALPRYCVVKNPPQVIC